MKGIEDGSLIWHTATEEEIRRDAEIEKAIADSIQIKITVGEEEIDEEKPRKSASIENGLATKTPEQARPKIRQTKGIKRASFAMLLALIGLFVPGLSIAAVPLMILGSEAIMRDQVKLGHKVKESWFAWLWLAVGILMGLLGVGLPVFTFLSYVFILQSYNLRCKGMYERLNV